MGAPPNHPFIDGFSVKNPPFWGTPFMEPPIYIHIYISTYHKHAAFVHQAACCGKGSIINLDRTACV